MPKNRFNFLYNAIGLQWNAVTTMLASAIVAFNNARITFNINFKAQHLFS
jgi:hypothetical protein